MDVIFRFLLLCEDLCVDVNVCDEYGISPLMHACIVNSEEIVRLLFDPHCSYSDAVTSGNLNNGRDSTGKGKKRKVKIRFTFLNVYCNRRCEVLMPLSLTRPARSIQGLP